MKRGGTGRLAACLAALSLLAQALGGCAAWDARALPPPAPVPAAAPPSSPATPVVPAPEACLSSARVLALQIGLDRLNFSPGCLDGRWGGQTRMALEAWQESAGEEATGVATDAIYGRLTPAAPLATCTVTEEDHGARTAIPAVWLDRAKMPRLGHETILEMVAERYHASEACVRELNPEAAWPDPPAGSTLAVPDIKPASRARAARLEVNLGRKFVRAYDEQGRLVAHFPCSIAKLKQKRPRGETTVVSVAGNPVYTFDPALFSDDPAALGLTGKLIIQAGPNNPVGAAWVGLALPGYGIHGTPWPEDIGKTASHGCIRLANWNAMKLVHMVRSGIPVRFIGLGEAEP